MSYKHMTAVWKKSYFDVLNNIINKYNDTCHNIIKVNTIHAKSTSYAKYNVDSNA